MKCLQELSMQLAFYFSYVLYGISLFSQHFFYREGNCGSERFSNLLKGTQPTWWQAWGVNSGPPAKELVFHYIHYLPNVAKLCHVFLC